MPDVVLPAGAAITAFVGAVLSWYGMLRTGIQLMYNDVHAARSVEQDTLAMLTDLNTQHGSVQAWKKRWFVADETPESVFKVFWGEEEYENIKQRLGNMDVHFFAARKKLSSIVNIPEAKWKAKHSLRRKYLKTRFLLMRKDYVQKLIDNLSKNLAGIQTAAENGWRRGDSFTRRGEIDSDTVYHEGIGHLLVRIALRTKDDANALHSGCCAAQNTFNVELELGLFNHATLSPNHSSSPDFSPGAASREENWTEIAAADNKGHFIWIVLSQTSQFNPTGLARLHVERATNRPTDGLLNYGTALARIMGGQATECYFFCSGQYFSIKMAGTPYETNFEPRQSLYPLLLNNNPSNENRLGSISKFRLIFELAQACLLLLRTEWFPRICSCDVHCGRPSQRSAEFTYDFGLRMGNFCHEVPQPQAANNAWCVTDYNWKFPTKPLRRIGLLLVEIVLETQIDSVDVNHDESRVVRRMTLLENTAGRTYDLSEILHRVRGKFGGSQRCENAIRHCLTKTFTEGPTDDEMRNILAGIYHEVVEP